MRIGSDESILNILAGRKAKNNTAIYGVILILKILLQNHDILPP
jgi:hypothetical protein